jgi:hypothetical protein
MTIRIFETLDITDRVLSLSREQAQWNEYDGLIAPVRSVQVFNSDGLFSPLSSKTSSNWLRYAPPAKTEFVEFGENRPSELKT